MRRSVLAFPYLLRSSFVRTFSRSPPSCSLVVVCGISYRLVCTSRLSSRPVVSFPVCLFRFRHVASRLLSRSLFLLLRLVVLPPYSLRSSVRPVSVSSLALLVSVRLRSSQLVVIIVIVVVRISPCCLCYRFRSCRPSLPVIASLLPRWRCSICVPFDVPYETTDAHDIPLICSPGRLPR